MHGNGDSRQDAPHPSREEALLGLLAQLWRELHPSEQSPPHITTTTRLERDLGLDSLARAELIARIDQAFGVNLSEQALIAETPGALLELVASAGAEPAEATQVIQGGKQTDYGDAPDAARTLTDVLGWHVERHPERVHLRLLSDSGGTTSLSFGALDTRAREAAAGLMAHGVGKGDNVAVMLPTGMDYFVTFFGIVLCGATPVPVYPPARLSQIEEHLRRHAKILDNASCRFLVTLPAAKPFSHLVKLQVRHLKRILTPSDLGSDGRRTAPRGQSPDLALLQYTSGSTGDPKGVMLSHANLLANIRAMGERVHARPDDVFISWLPLYHDMGLIGAWLGSLYHGFTLVIMSPLGFLARPTRWLWAMHRFRGTLSASPNFGYELCLRAAEKHPPVDLDLSAIRVLFNGAEPVSPTTLERFAKRFAANGLRAEALTPVYGLAESAVGLAIPVPGRGVRVEDVDRDAFMRTGRAKPVTSPGAARLRFVACGSALPGHEIRVVDAAGREAPERIEGRIEFRGPSATSGYYRNPEATAKLLRRGWLDTGDRGYLAAGEIFITGRVKDMIIRGGRNIYPYELEEAAGNIEGIRKGCVAAFASPDPNSGSERLIIVAETRASDEPTRQRLRTAITERVAELLGGPADEVHLVPPRSVLKTSSGKIRRSAVRALFERGRLGRANTPVWWQASRLAASAFAIRLRHGIRPWVDRCFAAYAWAVFGFFAVGVWCLLAITPGISRRWSVVRAGLRIIAPLVSLKISVFGLERAPHENQSCVLVANHASYLDALVITHAIPRNFRYVAKRELADYFFAGILLRRLGTLFVERFDTQRSASETDQITDAVGQGDSVAFFPEGTFDRRPGVRAFHMGAFLTAARAGVPVLPIALEGTRSALLGGEWFPRPGRVTVTLLSPLMPQGNGWADALRLRNDARQAITAQMGEPDLEG